VATLILFLKIFRIFLLRRRPCTYQAAAQTPINTSSSTWPSTQKLKTNSQSHVAIHRNTGISKTLEINNSEEMIIIQVHKRYNHRRLTKACKWHTSRNRMTIRCQTLRTNYKHCCLDDLSTFNMFPYFSRSGHYSMTYVKQKWTYQRLKCMIVQSDVSTNTQFKKTVLNTSLKIHCSFSLKK
jgi:hypothetical protein